MFTLCSLVSIRRNVEKRSINYLYQIQQQYPVIFNFGGKVNFMVLKPSHKFNNLEYWPFICLCCIVNKILADM